MVKDWIIAVDFDGTLCADEYPGIGEPNDRLIECLKREKKDGAKIILWTCRKGMRLVAAVEWCKQRGLIFDAVNENLPEVVEWFDGDTRKVFAHEYIDDRANAEWAIPHRRRIRNNVKIGRVVH